MKVVDQTGVPPPGLAVIALEVEVLVERLYGFGEVALRLGLVSPVEQRRRITLDLEAMDEVRGPTQDDQHRQKADQEDEVKFSHGCTNFLRIMVDHQSPLAARMIEPILESKRILDLELPGSLIATVGKPR